MDASGLTGAEPDPLTPGERAIGEFLTASHLAAPHEMPALIQDHAAILGVSDGRAYLVDLQQTVLVPFVGSAGPDPAAHLDVLPIDSTMAGRAFQHSEIQVQADTTHDGGRVRVWVPMLDGTDRLGVLSVVIGEAAALERNDRLLELRLRRFATLVAEILVTKTMYGDTIVRARRRAEMGLGAEIQWGLLPPLTFACRQVVVAAALEPAYNVAGDSVDYAVDAGWGRFAVFDGMGHGLQSAQLAALAVAAYRNARRGDASLIATAHTVDAAVRTVFGGDTFITAVLAELDLETGLLSWVNAGHPEPLLLREGHLVRSLRADPGLPFGLGLSAGPPTYRVATEHLQPGDRVLLYTDGITEARSPTGELFGIDRLVDLLARTYSAGLPAPETLRRVVRALLEHQQNQLSDDATLLLLEWHTGTQRRLVP